MAVEILVSGHRVTIDGQTVKAREPAIATSLAAALIREDEADGGTPDWPYPEFGAVQRAKDLFGARVLREPEAEGNVVVDVFGVQRVI